MTDLTTLQLARRIADAVFLALHPAGAGPNRSDHDATDPPTQAVLRVLHETGSWFSKVGEDEHGATTETDYELIQPDLFT